MTSATSQNTESTNHDPVNHPKHYTGHASGVECIQITEHMGFNLGNATKYIWRCDLKLDAIEDLKKARWYVDREIEKREREAEAKRTVTGAILRSRSDGTGTNIGSVFIDISAGNPTDTAKATTDALQRSFNGGNS